jgi:hypothetical protein
MACFEVRRRAYFAPDGAAVRPLPRFAADIGLLMGEYF